MALGNYLVRIALFIGWLCASACTDNSDGCFEQIYPIRTLLFDVGNQSSATFEMRSVDSPSVKIEMTMKADTFFKYTTGYSSNFCNHYVQCYQITYTNADKGMEMTLLQPALTDNGEVEFTFRPKLWQGELFYLGDLEGDGRIPVLNNLAHARLHKDSGLTFLQIDSLSFLQRVK